MSKQRMIIYDKTPDGERNGLPRANPFRIARGDVLSFEHDGIRAFAMGDSEVYGSNTLPTEFFNHQIMKVNLRSEESIRLFLEEWGFPFSPIRNNPHCLSVFGTLSEKHHAAIIDTDALGASQYGGGLNRPISLNEARFTLWTFQHMTKSLWRSVSTARAFEYGRFIDAGARPEKLLSGESWGSGDRCLAACGGLTSAICNQVLSSIMDEERPWRSCAVDDCPVLYKRKQAGRIVNTPSRESKFCCKECANRQTQANKRRRDREGRV